MEYNTKGQVLKKAVVWKDLYFYRKSDAIYQLTVEFCKRFLPAYGDRTVDQMVQAARSCKQNIVEGFADGRTSAEIELKLLGVARGSNQELFTIDSGMMEVLDLCRQSLSETPAFVLLTCHTPGYTPLVLSHLVSQTLPGGECATGEMTLPSADDVLPVPSGAYAWWTP